MNTHFLPFKHIAVVLLSVIESMEEREDHNSSRFRWSKPIFDWTAQVFVHELYNVSHQGNKALNAKYW